VPISGIQWDFEKNAITIHALAGHTSPDLRLKHLRFELPAAARTSTVTSDQTAHDYPFAKHYLDDAANGHDVTLTFTIADASAAPGASTRDFASHGITVDHATGAVTVAATLIEPFPRNFLLEVQAVSGTNTFKELIRIEVHRSIQRIWLTPSRLTVRARRNVALPQTLKSSKFAVRALFDDDVVGDISEQFAIQWSPTSNVTAEGELKVATGDGGGSQIPITATLTGFPTVAAASALLRVLDPWGPASPIDVRLVPGGGWAHPFAIEAVPNVLFLPDGFPSAWESDFHDYVNAIVQFLKTDPVCKPYDLLADSINFWAAFIPSDHVGVTWGSEIGPDLGGASASSMPMPKRPQGLTQPFWGISHLIYEVGLPLPRDARSNIARTNAMILADWDALFGTAYRSHLPTHPTLLDAQIDDWRDLSVRTLLDDIDSPLGTLCGAPRVDDENDMLSMNVNRMDRSRLDDLMSALRHDHAATSGIDLSRLWVDQLTRNYDLVCIIVPNEGRAANWDGYFYVNQPSFRSFAGANVQMVVDASSFSSTPRSAETRLFAHEFSHSFSLGDEYGGTEISRLTQPDVDRAQRAYPDLQSPNSLQRSGSIHGDEIKWRWPRIRWAAELIGPITSSASDVFEMPIRASHAFAFPARDQVVHLRFRNVDFAYRDVRFVDEASYLTKLPKLSVALRFVESFQTGSPSVMNVRLRFDSALNFQYPNLVQPGSFAAEFPAGSIVFAPTQAPAVAYDATNYPYAELIAKNIREHITQRVSSGQPGAVGGASSGFPETPDYSGFTFPSGFASAQQPLVVSLYEGGLGNDTGMFHPTGNCMMSDQSSGAQFCQVCRYMLVDAIDPGKHYFLDQEYDRVYPQR
jgi:hypothetical protein